jgi:hypothetical protein
MGPIPRTISGIPPTDQQISVEQRGRLAQRLHDVEQNRDSFHHALSRVDNEFLELTPHSQATDHRTEVCAICCLERQATICLQGQGPPMTASVFGLK